MIQWISIKDGLPTEEGRYLVFAESMDTRMPFIDFAWFNVDLQRWELIPTVWANAVTHWAQMSLPGRSSSVILENKDGITLDQLQNCLTNVPKLSLHGKSQIIYVENNQLLQQIKKVWVTADDSDIVFSTGIA